ncbi:EamA family transporter [Oscillatoria laete-virens NRMC-F 0139]|nr:EamA family transporter [Oscillatoria laete-virens]MDL5053652.1 EamA family transporter [Oscillatoria laete-virens NRMC-F 0139]
MTPVSLNRLKIILAFIAVYLIWGSTYLGMKFSVETIPPLYLSGFRFTLAGIILHFWSRFKGGSRLSAAQCREALISGICLVVCGNAVGSVAVQYLDSSVLALIYASVPLFMFLLTIRGHQRDHEFILKIAGIIMGFGGIYLLLSPHQDSWKSAGIFAALAALISAGIWAYASVRMRQVKVDDPVGFTSVQMISGGLIVLALSGGNGDWLTFHPADASLKSLGAFAFLVIFGSIIAFSSYNFLIRHVEISKVSTYAYVNPVIAVLLGIGLNGEHLPVHALLGALIVVISVFIVISAGSPWSNRHFLRLFKKQTTIAGE